MFGIAISSRIYNTIGSKSLPNPEEIPPFLAYDFAKLVNNKNINKATTIMVRTPFVIERSIGFAFVGCPCSSSKVPAASVLYIFSWCNL